MARVFISHAGADTLTAARVHRWLVDEGHDVFLDHDVVDGIRVGDDWVQRLHERLRWADAVVCVVTAAYVDSMWCGIEVGVAQSRGCLVLPLAAAPGVGHPLLAAVQHVDLADEDRARRALATELRRFGAAGGVGWPDGTSPFPGLVPFEAGLRHAFFGRSGEVRRMLEVLRSPAARSEHQVLLIVGPSGCGKSSLVRAGLVPAVAEEPGWATVAPFVPGNDPVGALAAALATAAEPLGLGWADADVRARLGTVGLAAVVRLWQVFPFDFAAGSAWVTIVRILLLLAMAGSVIGLVVQIVALGRAVAGRPLTG